MTRGFKKMNRASVFQFEGVTQFLTEGDATLDLDIDGASALSGKSADLVGDPVFKADGTSFAQGKSCWNGKKTWLASFSSH